MRLFLCADQEFLDSTIWPNYRWRRARAARRTSRGTIRSTVRFLAHLAVFFAISAISSLPANAVDNDHAGKGFPPALHIKGRSETQGAAPFFALSYPVAGAFFAD